MSGTSLDGVDAVLARCTAEHCDVLATYYLPYSAQLRQTLLALHQPTHDELQQSLLISNQLAQLYAQSVNALLQHANIAANRITAIGCHGQTIRHRPELGFTLQLGNPALLAELTNITVVDDFRSRDIAAGGQGAPLVPAFHHAMFSAPDENRVVLNIGGIANLTYLPAASTANAPIIAFDTGPGNLLLDAWMLEHQQQTYDANGNWARCGNVLPALLQQWLAHPYFKQPPPKSTGRDWFHLDWVKQSLPQHCAPHDVQRTLLELTAVSIADAINTQCPNAATVFVCGGGGYNGFLLERLQALLPHTAIMLTNQLGIAIDWVEAAAFAWLARQAWHGQTANLPQVTGARGARILGSITTA